MSQSQWYTAVAFLSIALVHDLGFRASAQTPVAENLDAKVERVADMLMDIQFKSVEFGESAVSKPEVLMSLAPRQGVAQVECLRTELSASAFRKRTIARVRAYAESDRDKFDASLVMLEEGLASLLRRYERGEPLTAFAEEDSRRLAVYFYLPRHRELRELLGHGYMEQSERMKSYADRLRTDGGSRFMAMVLDPAFQACRVPLTPWLAEAITYTKALIDPKELTPEFGRPCGSPLAAPNRNGGAVVIQASYDPMKPIRTPLYPKILLRAGVEGAVQVQVVINEQGQTVRARIHRTSGYVMFDSSALQAARDWQLRPSTVDGKPVCSGAILPVNFRLAANKGVAGTSTPK